MEEGLGREGCKELGGGGEAEDHAASAGCMIGVERRLYPTVEAITPAKQGLRPSDENDRVDDGKLKDLCIRVLDFCATVSQDGSGSGQNIK